MKRTPFRIAAALAAGALVLSACGGDEDNNSGNDNNAADNGANNGADDGANGDEASPDEGGGEAAEGSITIGIKYDQPGVGVREGDGDPVGMDVDVAIAVAGELGYQEDQITWQEAPTPQREDLLVNGQVDMIVATYSITDERKERVQFAGPYFVAGQDLLIRADDDSITGPEDLEGKILCSVVGSTSAANVQEEYGGNLQEYSTYSECVEQLINGVVDTLTTDDTILAGYAAQEEYAGQLSVVGNVFSEENYGIGLAQDNEQCEEINEIITGLWEDGTMDQIIQDSLGAANYSPDDSLNPPEAGGGCV